MRYTVIIEKEPQTSWGAWVPDLPGCVATGDTREEVEVLIREAIGQHLKGMRDDGFALPEPSSSSITVEVAA